MQPSAHARSVGNGCLETEAPLLSGLLLFKISRSPTVWRPITGLVPEVPSSRGLCQSLQEDFGRSSLLNTPVKFLVAIGGFSRWGIFSIWWFLDGGYPYGSCFWRWCSFGADSSQTPTKSFGQRIGGEEYFFMFFLMFFFFNDLLLWFFYDPKNARLGVPGEIRDSSSNAVMLGRG